MNQAYLYQKVDETQVGADAAGDDEVKYGRFETNRHEIKNKTQLS